MRQRYDFFKKDEGICTKKYTFATKMHNKIKE